MREGLGTLGWRRGLLSVHSRVGHGGRIAGFSAALDMDLEQKLGIIVFSNISDGNPESYLDQAFEIVAPAIVGAVAQDERDPGSSQKWEYYSGVYTSMDGAQKVVLLALDGRLTMIITNSSSPMKTRVVLDPVTEHTFKALMVNPIYHPTTLHGEIFTFDHDATGRMTGFGNRNFNWERE